MSDLDSKVNELNTSIANKFNGIDISKVLANGSISYTATEDCYINLHSSSNNFVYLRIDGVTLQTVVPYYRNTFPIKKGNVLTFESSGSFDYVIYGVKR